MIHFSFIRCSQCRYPLDFWLFSVSTFLGPELVKCRKCQCTITTGRSEWPQKSWKEKLKTAVMCALYLTIGGYGFGYAFYRMNEISQKLPQKKEPSLEEMKYQVMSGSFLMAMIIVIKFFNSLRRNPDEVSEENIYSWSLTFGTQMKMMILLFVLYLIAGAYS